MELIGHIVLLGDSIFDNSAYTRGEPDVCAHLQGILPSRWMASLLAIDGATTAGLPAQAERLPGDATHIVVSVGGNDALQNSDLLRQHASSSAQILNAFADRVECFEASYRNALAPLLRGHLPTMVCTIYNGNLPEPERRAARIALTTFNDVILRVAFDHRLDVIDLRSVCCAPDDYANPIEPSGTGGLKIAHAIRRAVGLDRPEKVSAVFAA